MTKLLDTIEEIQKGTIAKYKLYILVDDQQKIVKLVNITDIKTMTGTGDSFARLLSYTRLKIKEYKTNDDLEDIILSRKCLQYSIPHSHSTALSIGNGKYLMRYNNIYEIKKLIKGISIYGLGYQPQKMYLIDKGLVTFSAKQYRILINALKKMYKELRCDII